MGILGMLSFCLNQPGFTLGAGGNGIAVGKGEEGTHDRKGLTKGLTGDKETASDWGFCLVSRVFAAWLAFMLNLNTFRVIKYTLTSSTFPTILHGVTLPGFTQLSYNPASESICVYKICLK